MLGRLVVTLISLLILNACGDGGGSTTNNSNETNVTTTIIQGTQAPSSVTIVSLTSVSSESIILEWLEASDDTTPIGSIKYDIHLSEDNESFEPTVSTLFKSVTGKNYATVEGLEAQKTYYVKIVATDADGMNSTSTAQSITTVSTDISVATEAKYTPNITKQSDNRFSVDASSSIKADDIIVSDENGGFARRVVSVSEQNGSKILQTKPVSLSEIYNDVEATTSIELNDLSTALDTTTAKLRDNTNRISKSWKSGLTLYSTSSMKSKKVRSTGGDISTYYREAFNLSLPNYYLFEVDKLDTQTLTLDFSENLEEEWFFEDYYYDVCSVEAKVLLGTQELSVEGIKEILGEQEVRFTFDFSQYAHYFANAISDKPYKLSFSILSAKEDTCNSNKAYSTQEYFSRDIYISDGSIELFRLEDEVNLFAEDVDAANLGYKFISKVSGSYVPKLTLDSFIKDGVLSSGKVEVSADITLEHFIQALFIANKKVEKSKKLFSKEFTKVIQVGAIPLVFSGEFRVDVAIEGEADGSIELNNTISNNYSMKVGFSYNKTTGKWDYIGESKNEFNVRFEGEARAELNLRVSLVPKLTLKLYDMVGGAAILEPYVFANAAAQTGYSSGVTLEMLQSLNLTTDYFYNTYFLFSTLEAGIGLDMRYYVIAQLWDYRLVSFPEDVNEDDLSTYEHIENIIEPINIAQLPEANITTDAYLNELGRDSRLLKIKVESLPLENPLYTSLGMGKQYIIEHKSWDFAYQLYQGDEQKLLERIDDTTFVLLMDKLTVDGVSITGRTSLYLPYKVTASMTSSDANHNTIPDSWEKAYDVYEDGANADSDSDGLDNAMEYALGLYPNLVDSDGDGCSDGYDSNLSNNSDDEDCLYMTRDYENEVVIDHSNNLMWQDNAEVLTPKKPWLSQENYNNGNYFDTSGDTVTTYCENLTLGGYSNWRLPSIEEAQKLPNGNLRKYSASINEALYYTSQSDANDASWAYIYNSNGTITKALKYSNRNLRCVRSTDGE
jgi:hypothetical protein